MILGVLFIYSSCETTVDIDIPFDKPQVTVNSSLAHNTFPKVRVTYSKHILDNNWEFEPVRDAEVKLIHQGETYPLSFDEATGEFISLDHMISEGNEYKIEVLVEGYEPVTATEIIPVRVPIKNLVYQGQVQVDSWSSRDDIQLSFDDPEGKIIMRFQPNIIERILTRIRTEIWYIMKIIIPFIWSLKIQLMKRILIRTGSC